MTVARTKEWSGNAERPAGHPAGRSHTLNVGDDLLSHTLTSAVPSALEGLATGFGMGPGVPPPLKPPTTQSIQLDPTQTNRRPTTTQTSKRAMVVVVCSGSHSGCETVS